MILFRKENDLSAKYILFNGTIVLFDSVIFVLVVFSVEIVFNTKIIE